jgi:hypothetical protein
VTVAHADGAVHAADRDHGARLHRVGVAAERRRHDRGVGRGRWGGLLSCRRLGGGSRGVESRAHRRRES